MHADAAARVLRQDGRRQRRPQGLHRGLLLPAAPAPTSRRCSTRCEYLRHETDVWFEITTLLIPGHNDSDAEIDAMRDWIAERARARRAAALHGVPSRLQDAGRAADAAGDADARPRASRSATACTTSTPATCTTSRAARPSAPPAAQAVVERDWYAVLSCRIETRGDAHGTCPHCGTPIAGRFGAFERRLRAAADSGADGGVALQ